MQKNCIHSHIAGGKSNGRATVKNILKKPNRQLPYDPALTFLGIYLRKREDFISRKTCTQIFTASFAVTQNDKNPK